MDPVATLQASVDDLRNTVTEHSREILHLRAAVDGLTNILCARVSHVTREDIDRAIRDALDALSPAIPGATLAAARRARDEKAIGAGMPVDPYRGLPTDAHDDPAAQELLVRAQHLHYAKQFGEARTLYQQIVDHYGPTKQAITARAQLDNLKSV
ncbi:MAG: hypothetical protein QM831_38695 [Kofleriaceae bacterium]